MYQQIKRMGSELPSGQNYYFERREIKTGSYFFPHWHDYFEFELVLKGTGEHLYNHTRETLKRGSAYLMSYYDFHELRATEDMSLLKLQFNEYMLPQELNNFIFLNQNRCCCAMTEQEIARIEMLFEMIETDSHEHTLFSEQTVRGALLLVIVEAIRKASPMPKVESMGLIQESIAYIHKHFREDFALTDLAKHCSVTPNYLGTRFLSCMGMSFSDYVNTVRLRHACNLLLGTDLPVKQIAFSSGYRSVEYFFYVFKRKLSCTPRDFRGMARIGG